ncbi:MAG: MFS transporter [Clostridia bacterium]|nr:MFS transporter [Clostridia bacterium]
MKNQDAAAKPAEKLNYPRTFLIGFGFMGCMALWSVYNSYVPVILRGKLSEVFAGDGAFATYLHGHSWLAWLTVPLIVNAIMTIDNVFGVIFQPYFGKKSDHTHTKMGKRMPYILVFLPLCALAFCFIPVAATVKAVGLSILLMMSVIICFNFMMSIWRSPVVSLMPDFTPSHLQSDANAVINIMGGVGQMVGFVVGIIASTVIGLLGFTQMSEALKASKNELGQIVDDAGNLVLNAAGEPQYINYTPVFVVTATISVLCLVVLTIFYVRNRKYDLSAQVGFQETDTTENKKKNKIKIKNLPITKEEKRSLLIMLAALFLINNATEAIVSNFTNFADDTLHVPAIYSTLMMAVFAVSLAAFGIPAGVMGRKLGRKKTIMIGLAGIVAMFAVYLTVSQILPSKNDGSVNTFTWVILWIALVVGGAAVGCININTLPLVLAIGGREYVGTFTGYYYTATMSASVTGPILCGLVIGLFKEDYNYMFLFCAVMFAIGLAVISQVRHGETSKDDEEWLKEAVDNAD